MAKRPSLNTGDQGESETTGPAITDTPPASELSRSYARVPIGPRIDTRALPNDKDALVPEAEGDDDVVFCDFPREVNLQHGGMMHQFPKGNSIRARASVVLDDEGELHWYLRHHGVKMHT